ncbi:MAG TPA: 3-isopropylmalate dehydratase small subunit [Allosphingosinicella sp.]|nr:3-isopropylmalate dehydratase small subunit [Allosphingosinicella sp.]
MAPRLRITGPAIPFGRANVDTDLIIPARYMRTLTRDGLGAGAFAALRGQAGNPFEHPWYRAAPILVAGSNFGCGSSREHAVWALQQIGIEAVIAPSFGEIFEANALRNGLVAVRIPDEEVEALLELGPDQHLTIDIIGERVIAPHGEVEFHLDPFRRHCLVNGLDEIAVTERLEAEIAAYEKRARQERSWEQQA